MRRLYHWLKYADPVDMLISALILAMVVFAWFALIVGIDCFLDATCTIPVCA